VKIPDTSEELLVSGSIPDFRIRKAMVKSCGMKLFSDRLRREELLRYSISKTLFPFDLLVVIT